MDVTDIARARAEREASLRAVAAWVEKVERIAFELGVISGCTVDRGLLSTGALRSLVDNAQMLVDLIVDGAAMAVGAEGAAVDSAEGAGLKACNWGAKRAEALEALSQVRQAWALVDPSDPRRPRPERPA